MIELVTAFFAAVAGWCSFRANKHGKEVNDAINHTHEDNPRIYDLVLRNHEDVARLAEQSDELLEWKRGYDGSPWTDAGAIKEWIEEIEKRCPLREDDHD